MVLKMGGRRPTARTRFPSDPNNCRVCITSAQRYIRPTILRTYVRTVHGFFSSFKLLLTGADTGFIQKQKKNPDVVTKRRVGGVGGEIVLDCFSVLH